MVYRIFSLKLRPLILNDSISYHRILSRKTRNYTTSCINSDILMSIHSIAIPSIPITYLDNKNTYLYYAHTPNSHFSN